MTKKRLTFLIIFLLLLLAIIGGFFFSSKSSYRIEQQWRGWQGEAKKKENFLAKKLLEHYGAKVTLRRHAREPWILEPIDTLILSPKAKLSNIQANSVKQWVIAGGHLVLSDYPNNPIFDITISEQPQTKEANAYWHSFTAHAPNNICAHFSYQKTAPIQTISTKTGCQELAQFSVGTGKITVYNAPFLNNFSDNNPMTIGLKADKSDIPILQYDHAVILRHLMQDSKNILWIQSTAAPPPQLPSLRWIISIAFILLTIGAILWRFGSRFGRLIPSASTPPKTQWLRHFYATGNYLLTNGAREKLLTASRTRLKNLPTVYLTPAQIQKREALLNCSVNNDIEFTHTIAAIEQLRIECTKSTQGTL
ncbi:DUF4350 domain-containing protein [Suttonella ornithocola]|uniref:DUF4350 domain-containing protein n=1 Tax=Suttonella ornithocola TaxID=279832 RepID=A0A380MV18_9GAMM|nr:DUF4350 domain-containing protein [Suttonella ornithocola]SUO96440.1 Uncharacterised protein [Suttonella ornithocola]